MAMRWFYVVGLTAVVVGSLTGMFGVEGDPVRRSDFPPGFLFGASSSAYQYEGAVKEGGRGPSIWDHYSHTHPEKIADHSNGDVAVDFYHRYKEDVSIMKGMGMDAFRFSISWSRILPNGSLSGGVNGEGIKFYNNLINELLSQGMEPYATLVHFDPPQGLEEAYGGFLSNKIAEDFRDYANICFKEFGDRVKRWITINEPWTFSSFGYARAIIAPGRCSDQCQAGDSAKEPYLVAHNQLLAHAAAVALYRDTYKASQNGTIGIILNCEWFEPFSRSESDLEAARRSLDFMFGWFMDPLVRGDYPVTMRSIVKERLPKFTSEQSKMVKGSFDFIGLNYYTAHYTADAPASSNAPVSSTTDSHANLTEVRHGIPIGPKAASPWLLVYPPGIHNLLVYIKQTYNNPVIYITENGVDEVNNSTLSVHEALNDDMRINYYRRHLSYLLKAIRDGVDVRGYLVWTLLDDYEFSDGFSVRFGINYVDFKDGLKRYPKKSAFWFKNFLSS